MADGKFTNHVRSGKIKWPTQRGYSQESWSRAYSQNTPTINCRRIHDAGLWFDKHLTSCRDKFLELRPLMQPAEEIRAYLAMINRDWMLVKNQIRPRSKGDSIAHLLTQAVHVPALGVAMSPDAAMQGAVDTFALMIRLVDATKTISIPRGMADDHLPAIDQLGKRFFVGSAYATMENLWAEVVWGDLTVEDADDVVRLRWKDKDIAANLEAGRLRERMLTLTMIEMSKRLWETLPLESRIEEALRRRVCAIEGSGKGRRIKLSTSTGPPSYESLITIASFEPYLAPLFSEAMPNYPLVNGKLLLRAREVLESLASAIEARMPKDAGIMKVGTLWGYAPMFERKELALMLRNALEVSDQAVDEVLNFFVHDPTSQEKRNDLWVRPIVEIGDRYGLLLPAATSAYLPRVFETWLSIGGIDLGRRGHIFEEYVRAEVSDAILKSHLGRPFFRSCDNSVILSPNTSIAEQVDLIVCIGNLVLVADVKCNLFPVTPVEQEYYIQQLRKAAEQAKRKAKRISDPAVLRDEVGLEIAGDYTCRPFVLTNQTCGAGLTIDDVAVIDLRILLRYFDGKLEKHVRFTKGGGHVAKEIVRFYSTAEEAQSRILTYLASPPQVVELLQWVQYEDHPVMSFVNLKPIVHEVISILPPQT